MRLENITAIPHSSGNRIDLTWVNPDPDQYPGVRVVRREGTHPTSPEDGILVTEGENLHYTVNENGERLYNVKDENLKGETVYYYTLFPYRGNPPEYQFDRHNRTAAMATALYNMAGQMYDLLPGIYHRYDTALPKSDGMSEEDKQRGQLRRFLDLPGNQLDQLYSFARAMMDLHNIDKVDGRLLPLLAQWIGWQTDYKQEIDAQRNEIRNAPSVYKTIGIIPTVEATVKRILGWESRTKEFVHNVFLSNRPERLNLWARQRSSAGEWSEPTEPLSLDFAYEGRPTAVRDGDGTLWLFYHTLKKGKWDIWYKTLSTFSIALRFQSDLDDGAISTDLQQAFVDAGFSLSQDATIQKTNSGWLITDADNRETYTVKKEAGQLYVYGWASKPFTNRKRLDKHPTAVFRGEALWVFWDSYDETDPMWCINYRTQTDGEWSSIATLTKDPPEAPKTERRQPWAVVDNADGLWLFWLEKVGTRWQLKYNRHDDPDWDAESASNFLKSANSFPLDDGEDPRVESDLFALFHLHPTDATQRLWVFWARKEPTGEPNQTRWQIAYRVKQGLDPSASDWSEVHTLPKEPPNADYHDREPAALVDADGNIELFWSSNRYGSWSIWRNTLDIAANNLGCLFGWIPRVGRNTSDIAMNNWGDGEQVTNNPYSQRTPLPLSIDDGTLLIYRSNESLSYTSEVYGATETLDARYAGCTTVDTRNAGKIALRGKFEDFQTYTYDAGKNGERTNDDWYARDTIGLYLTPDTMDAEKRALGISRIKKVLGEFMPITDRVVFIPRLNLHTERVYTYGVPLTGESRFINEFYEDTLT